MARNSRSFAAAFVAYICIVVATRKIAIVHACRPNIQFRALGVSQADFGLGFTINPFERNPFATKNDFITARRFTPNCDPTRRFAADERYLAYCPNDSTRTCTRKCDSNKQCEEKKDTGLNFDGSGDLPVMTLNKVCMTRSETWTPSETLPTYRTFEDLQVTLNKPTAINTYQGCGCTFSQQCRNQQKCVDNSCVCESSFQCGSGRVCTFFGWFSRDDGGYITGRIVQPDPTQNSYFQSDGKISRQFSPDVEKLRYGSCSCDVLQGTAGCNGRGNCVKIENSMLIGPNTDNFGAFFAFKLPSSLASQNRVPQGYCKCFNGFSGEFCENNDARSDFCLDRGTPLCPITQRQDDSQVRSKTTGLIIPNLFQCNVRSFTATSEKPGSRGCQCDPGWGPDVPADTGVPGKRGQTCHRRTTCPVAGQSGNQVTVGGAIQPDGSCKCFADFYDTILNPEDIDELTGVSAGSCTPNCRRDRCSAHGQCAPGSSDVIYNSACRCDSGWGTAEQTSLANAAESAFSKQVFCNQPFDINTKKVCGKWAQAINSPQDNYCQRLTQYLSLNIKLDQEITGLFIHQCPATQIGAVFTEACGGLTRGQCVEDGFFGQECNCFNGFTGEGCEILTCPAVSYNRGAVCSGNGVCDNPSIGTPGFSSSQGRCLCQTGFFGEACEHKRLNCGIAQTVKSYPSCQNIFLPPQLAPVCPVTS